MSVTKAELARAAAIADANKKATEALEQAGRGLHMLWQQTAANASDLETIQNLAAVQSYINDAMLILLTKENGPGKPAEKRLIVG